MSKQTAPKIARRDNGYFEIWTLPCGEEVRISTEDKQTRLRRAGERARFHSETRAFLSTVDCRCSR